MKIYDKAQWHIDAGESERLVLDRFNVVFSFLQEQNLLSEEGIEICDLGIDESVSLHERLLTEEGNKLLERYYDCVISLEASEIKDALYSYFKEIS